MFLLNLIQEQTRVIFFDVCAFFVGSCLFVYTVILIHTGVMA
jgi:hypothetical protein